MNSKKNSFTTQMRYGISHMELAIAHLVYRLEMYVQGRTPLTDTAGIFTDPEASHSRSEVNGSLYQHEYQRD